MSTATPTAITTDDVTARDDGDAIVVTFVGRTGGKQEASQAARALVRATGGGRRLRYAYAAVTGELDDGSPIATYGYAVV